MPPITSLHSEETDGSDLPTCTSGCLRTSVVKRGFKRFEASAYAGAGSFRAGESIEKCQGAGQPSRPMILSCRHCASLRLKWHDGSSKTPNFGGYGVSSEAGHAVAALGLSWYPQAMEQLICIFGYDFLQLESSQPFWHFCDRKRGRVICSHCAAQRSMRQSDADAANLISWRSTGVPRSALWDLMSCAAKRAGLKL